MPALQNIGVYGVYACVRAHARALTSLAIPDMGGASVPADCKSEKLNFNSHNKPSLVGLIQNAPEASHCVSI